MAAAADFATADHYKVLGVARGSSDADITKAYKALARRYHPDKNPEKKAEAEINFKRIAEAYAILHDAEKRREYDSNGSTRSHVSYEEAERMWNSYGFGNEEDVEQGFQGQVREEEDSRRKIIVGAILVLATLFLVPQVVMQLLPGLTAALLGVALLTRREQNSSKWAWCLVALLLVGYLAPTALRMQSRLAARSLTGVEPPRGGAMHADSAGSPMGTPHSGELVLMSDGSFAVLADPTQPEGDGSVTNGWQQRLLQTMTTAIRSGQEQVVMVFSRQGCPWCDRQVPVLQRAIQKRSGAAGDADDAGMEEAAFVLPFGTAAVGLGAPPHAAGTLLYAPLRVFIFDAGEFPTFAQTFRVEAFPTTIAWGSPGVAPMAAQGYLDDQNFEELTRTVASASPSGGKKKKKRGLFR